MTEVPAIPPKIETFVKAMLDVFGERAEAVARAQVASFSDDAELRATWQAIQGALATAR